ncbi:MAG: hypothetical protein A2V64_08760 [Bacteroidetes bacterium RBG_13_43_22]|nr:MAG: hypothetical protein A2V64_08760 [Bacteroidetes bacterium RBG_13_43_22]
MIMLASFTGSYGQLADDALRYSQVFYTGTARFMSMGGAFTALGGDISSLSQNPAGIGVFRSSELSLTPQLFHIKTTASLNGSKTSDYIYNFNLAQAGMVANIIDNNSESGLLSLNFGYSFNKTNNLNQSIIIDGISDYSSLTDFWADNAEGYYKDELIDEVPDSYLAWETWLLDSLPGYNTSYGTVFSNYGDDPPSVYGQNMRRLVSYEGYTGEHAISVGGNLSNKLYFGASLGISHLDYSSKYEHLESTDISLPSEFESFNYTFYYSNKGTGYGLKLGAIYRPLEILRIGFAFHSPTLYKINEYVYDNMSSHFTDGGRYNASNSAVRYSYALTTPFRAMAGVALQVKKLALVSIDYEFVDYSTARFSETEDRYDYSDKNSVIKSTLRSSTNLRLGAEFRLDRFYLRGGYAYYGKAWASDDLNSNLDYNSISFGAGFREQNVFIDFGYTGIMNTQQYVLYSSSVENLISGMDINRNVFTVTFGYKFGY